jgi:putative transposase
MTHEPVERRRRSLRLSGYDYAQAGAYFVTICTQNRACLFGEIASGAMRPNGAGELATRLWHEMPERFFDLEVDASVVMPNHIHGILVLSDVGAPLVDARDEAIDAGAATRAAPTAVRATIGDIVGAFKSRFTVEFIRGVRDGRWPAFSRRVWQRNYYEHVIRDDRELARVRRYIEENPLRWEFDQENPQRVET